MPNLERTSSDKRVYKLVVRKSPDERLQLSFACTIRERYAKSVLCFNQLLFKLFVSNFPVVVTGNSRKPFERLQHHWTNACTFLPSEDCSAGLQYLAATQRTSRAYGCTSSADALSTRISVRVWLLLGMLRVSDIWK